MSRYFLILKTGASEMRAFRHLRAPYKQYLSPVVELTRGRKNHKSTLAKTGEVYNFQGVLSFLREEIAQGQFAFLDVTREEDLLSEELIQLASSHNGYAAWVEFVRHQKALNSGFNPMLQVNPAEGDDWSKFQSDLTAQFLSLSGISSAIGYRAVAKSDSEFDIDLQMLAPLVSQFVHSGGEFYIFLDYGYVRPGTGELQSIETSEILRTVNEICPLAQLVLVSTSFPKSVTDIGGEDYGDFRLEEVQLHAETARRLHNVVSVQYGDYGSINPLRNDGVARGWRPRIDFPYNGRNLVYHREKRDRIGGKDSEIYATYASHYRSVAIKMIHEPAFINDPISAELDCWGVHQIRSAANSAVPSSAASFWISVRMNIHIEQQVKRLQQTDDSPWTNTLREFLS